jgi:hypothetical protein
VTYIAWHGAGVWDESVLLRCVAFGGVAVAMLAVVVWLARAQGTTVYRGMRDGT